MQCNQIGMERIAIDGSDVKLNLLYFVYHTKSFSHILL